MRKDPTMICGGCGKSIDDAMHAVGSDGRTYHVDCETPVVGTWSPAGSAPKDGRAFLITTGGPNVDICWWDESRGAFFDYHYKQMIANKWPYMVAWMPLPEPADVMAFKPTTDQPAAA